MIKSLVSFYVLLFLITSISCKTSQSTKTPLQAPEFSKACQATFKTSEGVVVEEYKYLDGHPILTHRFDAAKTQLFEEQMTWEHDQLQTKERWVKGKLVFRIRYLYENSRLKEEQIDDGDEMGNLEVDGKADLFKHFSYRGELLTKIRIQREGFTDLVVKLTYNSENQEMERTTFQGEKRIERIQHEYAKGLKIRSRVETFPAAGPLHVYDFSYDEKNRLIKTRMSGGEQAERILIQKYDCP